MNYDGAIQAGYLGQQLKEIVAKLAILQDNKSVFDVQLTIETVDYDDAVEAVNLNGDVAFNANIKTVVISNYISELTSRKTDLEQQLQDVINSIN